MRGVTTLLFLLLLFLLLILVRARMQIEDNISATFLPPTILNRGTTIVEVSVDCPDERYAVADLLLPSGVSWPKYATGMIRFGAGQNQKGSIRLLVNNAPAALTYIVQVWTVP